MIHCINTIYYIVLGLNLNFCCRQQRVSKVCPIDLRPGALTENGPTQRSNRADLPDFSFNSVEPQPVLTTEILRS